MEEKQNFDTVSIEAEKPKRAKAVKKTGGKTSKSAGTGRKRTKEDVKKQESRLLKDCMLRLLAMPAGGAENLSSLLKAGLDADNADNMELLAASLFINAVENANVSAFKEIRSILEEDGADENGQIEKLIEGLRESSEAGE